MDEMDRHIRRVVVVGGACGTPPSAEWIVACADGGADTGRAEGRRAEWEGRRDEG